MISNQNQAELFKQFQYLTDSNWRNSFYIECTACRYDRPPNCGDFLFVPDESGRPLLIPVTLACTEIGVIDWSECLGQMSNLMFCEFYRRWLCSRTTERGECPLLSCAKDTINRFPIGNR